ncbi:MAG: hypothetical protein V3S08_09695 [Phycisphaerales bacterium]
MFDPDQPAAPGYPESTPFQTRIICEPGQLLDGRAGNRLQRFLDITDASG